MTASFKTWKVLSHGKLTKVEENILTVVGEIPMPVGGLQRRMTVVRLNDGRLVIFSAISLDEHEMRELEEYGRPAFLIVPSLLTGEAALPSTVEAARRISEEDPSVDTVCEVLSMQLGPDEILMAATLDFADSLSAPQLEEAADDLSKKLRFADPRITRVFLRPGRALT